MPEILSMQGVHKRFGAVHALRGVSLAVEEGDIHALIGENGAGKSTLMKIISGAYQADAGEIYYKGENYRIQSPADARQQGIGMIYQELNLAMHLTVMENLSLGIEVHRCGFVKDQRSKAKDALALLGYDIDLQAKVYELSNAERQIVEIARSLMLDARLIILDEPTSSLSVEDSRQLFKALRRLREKGVSMIYISHFLEEIKEIADRFTVIRDGETVHCGEVAETDIETIIKHMVGRELDELYPHTAHEIRERVLSVKGFSNNHVHDVHFELAAGEIMGIAGLVGSGRTELLRGIFGQDFIEGEMIVHGKTVQMKKMNARKAMKLGIDMLSENRKDEGLALPLSIRQNMSLAALKKFSSFGFLKLGKEKAAVNTQIDQMALKCHDLDQEAQALSGGNQQKIAIGRLLVNGADILLLDEPTRGVDVGSKAEIYRLIGELVKAGKAVIMVSSYLPELFGVCDSLAVMHKGHLSQKHGIDAWDEEAVMAYASTGNEAEIKVAS